MAEVVLPGQHRYSRSIGTMFPTPSLPPPAPNVEMVPNPDFVFPRLPQNARISNSTSSSISPKRPLSLNMGSQRPVNAEGGHKKAVSTLPNFNFNASDSSGIQTEQPGVDAAQATPSRGGHKRSTSEFVGGVGMNGAVSASPTRSSALQVPEGRGHRHRRSVAVSHDLSKMMAGPDPQPRLSSSLPSTPFEFPSSAPAQPYFGGEARVEESSVDVFGPVLDNSLVRPPSRPRVEFSDNVEYIPRPLSTISSSETESSMSTVRGHSVNNSISSVLSMSTPSPPSSRVRATSLETTLEDEPKMSVKRLPEISKRVEREGEWLKHGTPTTSIQRPVTEPVGESSKLSFAVEDHSTIAHVPRRKKHSSSRSLGFDRRRSEPAIGTQTSEPSRLSALSLQMPASSVESTDEDPTHTSDRRSSTRRIKDWAVAKITRRPRLHSGYLTPAVTSESNYATPVAETDLDAVFSMGSDVVQSSTGVSQPLFEAPTPSMSHQSSFEDHDSEEYGTMLDLDAALGPFKTPSIGLQKRPKQLHSYRRFDDFVGPGLHYQPIHERTLSAPVLMAFDQSTVGTPPQQPMADVFEEEEEDEELAASALRRVRTQSAGNETFGIGVAIVDRDESMPDSSGAMGFDDGLGIQREDWELERPSTSYGIVASRLSTPIVDHRSPSLIEQTILEEASPTEPVAIVEDHEDPRAHSLTKSSDSSETATVLACQTDMLSPPDSQQRFATPDTSSSSAFSSPDFVRRQGSFDTSRLGTSTSSITDNRTTSSCATGDQVHDTRISVDDVPSLTSSRSTMISTMHANSSRKDISGLRTPSVASGTPGSAAATERRRKRTSIQSLSQLVGSSFGSRPNGLDEARPRTATDANVLSSIPKKKEHRLKKLMFWKSKHRHVSSSTIL